MIAIGTIHLLHSPLLVLFPFIINNFTTDIFYIIYFFTIMFLYTFIRGECPISYVCKRMIDKDYVAGTNITYYPEMEYLLHSQKNIDYYFGTMTFLYITTLFFVIFRTNTFSFLLLFTFLILLLYFSLVRKHFIINEKCFLIIQETTKCVLLLTICFFLSGYICKIS
jgi:hypothetical protein